MGLSDFLCRRFRADGTADFEASLEKLADDVRSHESRCSGNEDCLGHSVLVEGAVSAAKMNEL